MFLDGFELLTNACTAEIWRAAGVAASGCATLNITLPAQLCGA